MEAGEITLVPPSTSVRKQCLIFQVFYPILQRTVTEESKHLEAERTPVDLQSLSTRAYLDYTVVPIIMDAMTAVAKER